jgi:hypothetical protein
MFPDYERMRHLKTARNTQRPDGEDGRTVSSVGDLNARVLLLP